MVEELIKINESTYIVSAEMAMSDLYELLNLGKAPNSSYTNVGGFLYSLAEEVPIESETFKAQMVMRLLRKTKFFLNSQY